MTHLTVCNPYSTTSTSIRSKVAKLYRRQVGSRCDTRENLIHSFSLSLNQNHLSCRCPTRNCHCRWRRSQGLMTRIPTRNQSLKRRKTNQRMIQPLLPPPPSKNNKKENTQHGMEGGGVERNYHPAADNHSTQECKIFRPQLYNTPKLQILCEAPKGIQYVKSAVPKPSIETNPMIPKLQQQMVWSGYKDRNDQS